MKHFLLSWTISPLLNHSPFFRTTSSLPVPISHFLNPLPKWENCSGNGKMVQERTKWFGKEKNGLGKVEMIQGLNHFPMSWFSQLSPGTCPSCTLWCSAVAPCCSPAPASRSAGQLPRPSPSCRPSTSVTSGTSSTATTASVSRYRSTTLSPKAGSTRWSSSAESTRPRSLSSRTRT